MGCRVRASAVAAVLAAAVVLCGCGSPAAHSAPRACKDFQSWFLGQGGNILAGNDKSLLVQAVDQAPSGQLYEDLSTLKSNMATASASQGSSLGIPEKTLTDESALRVSQDCQSVNTSS
jgi:hypothetical protein